MMIITSNGEHCYELFELFHKDSFQSQMQSRETEIVIWTDGEDSLKEFLAFCQWNKEYEVSR